MLLILHDLSAAFDRVDHNVLFFQLKYMFGLSGKVLQWFQSNLEQCSQRISVHFVSDILSLFTGVEQDSIPGLLVSQ
jgi:hypothetical protein